MVEATNAENECTKSALARHNQIMHMASRHASIDLPHLMSGCRVGAALLHRELSVSALGRERQSRSLESGRGRGTKLLTEPQGLQPPLKPALRPAPVPVPNSRFVALSVRTLCNTHRRHSLQSCRPVVPVNETPTYAIAAVFVAIGSHVRVALKYAQEH